MLGSARLLLLLLLLLLLSAFPPPAGAQVQHGGGRGAPLALGLSSHPVPLLDLSETQPAPDTAARPSARSIWCARRSASAGRPRRRV